ncbi:MAG: RNA methyltransferase [Candidatus Margulisbacteria bacterium]|nr:RNA methyltransferase [Candidatus Margulisiibacteriota bacterium]
MNTLISSKTNSKITFLKKLSKKKYRDETNNFLIENLKIICDAFKSGYSFESLFIDAELLRKKDAMLSYLLSKTADYFIIDENINKYFSNLDTPSGICAVYKKIPGRIDIKKSIVYLNGVSDPGNMGTILRTAMAFGFANVVVDETCADVYNSKTIQAAKDSIFKLNIEKDSGCSLIKKIKTKMPIFTTRLEKAQDIADLGTVGNFCLVLGNEASGVSSEIQKISDKFLKIPISKNMESINVAVAAGILFYTLTLGTAQPEM